jgi:hypothetical protein
MKMTQYRAVSFGVARSQSQMRLPCLPSTTYTGGFVSRITAIKHVAKTRADRFLFGNPILLR